MLGGTVTEYQRLRGPDHPDTLAARDELAAAYRAAGRLTGAQSLLRETLTRCEPVLSPATG